MEFRTNKCIKIKLGESRVLDTCSWKCVFFFWVVLIEMDGKEI